MSRVVYHLRKDSDGTYAGGGLEESPRATLALIQARQPAGITALDASIAPRPPDPPSPDQVKRDRLAVLRRIGWQTRTPAETAELDGLARDLGL